MDSNAGAASPCVTSGMNEEQELQAPQEVQALMEPQAEPAALQLEEVLQATLF